MEATKGPRFPISNMSSSQFYWGIKWAIGEIRDWKKAKPLYALNMIQGLIFSGLIPIRPLKIHLV